MRGRGSCPGFGPGLVEQSRLRCLKQWLDPPSVLNQHRPDSKLLSVSSQEAELLSKGAPAQIPREPAPSQKPGAARESLRKECYASCQLHDTSITSRALVCRKTPSWRCAHVLRTDVLTRPHQLWASASEAQDTFAVSRACRSHFSELQGLATEDELPHVTELPWIFARGRECPHHTRR